MRSNPLVQVSTDKIVWEDIGFQEGTPTHVFNSDFNEQVVSLRGRSVSDPNLQRMYWSLSDYADEIGPEGKLYVKLGYTEEYKNNLSPVNIGSDVIDGITYYERIVFDELDNRFTLTLGEGVSFVGGGKTVLLRPGRPMPAVVFDDPEVEIDGVTWSDGADKTWTGRGFKMPARDVTVDMTYNNSRFALSLGGGMSFEDGGKTKVLFEGEALPKIVFDDTGVDPATAYLLGDNGRVYFASEFNMPAVDLTLNYAAVVNPYKGSNGYSSVFATEQGQYLIGDGGFSQQPTGVVIPNTGRGELIATSDGKLAQLYNLPNVTEGYAFRLQTTPRRASNTEYTYDVSYAFYNMSDTAVTITVYQINSGKNTDGCVSGTVTLQAGESKTAELKDVGFEGSNNFLTYFVFSGAEAEALPIAVATYITPKPVG